MTTTTGPFVFHTFEWEDEFHPKGSDDDDDDQDDDDDEDEDDGDDGQKRAGARSRDSNRMPVPSRVKPKDDSRDESPCSHDTASGKLTPEQRDTAIL